MFYYSKYSCIRQITIAKVDWLLRELCLSLDIPSWVIMLMALKRCIVNGVAMTSTTTPVLFVRGVRH